MTDQEAANIFAAVAAGALAVGVMIAAWLHEPVAAIALALIALVIVLGAFAPQEPR